MGAEFCRQLSRKGYKVHATLRDPAQGEALQAELAAEGFPLTLHRLDQRDEAQVAALASELGQQAGRLDLLVNNAGINARSGRPDHFPDTFQLSSLRREALLDMLHVNAVAPLMLTQQLLPLLQQAASARVLNISSWLGSLELKTQGSNYGYSASKAALNLFTRALAADLLPLGIVAVAVNPGWVQTDMGGSRARLTAEESVRGILEMAEALGPADAGRFLQWDGTPHPW